MCVKDQTTREVLVLEFIKQMDPFMCLRMGAWGPTLDLSIGQREWLLQKLRGALSFEAEIQQQWAWGHLLQSQRERRRLPPRRNPRERHWSPQLRGL